MVDAEEAEELKRALSSQMLQLLFEQEQRLEGYLRECITFDGGARPVFPGRHEGDSVRGGEDGVRVGSGGGGRRSGDTPSSYRSRAISSSSPRSSLSRKKGDTVEEKDEASGDVPREREMVEPSSVRVNTPTYGNAIGDAEEDEDGFEKVESWMAEGLEGGPERGALGPGERGRGERDGSSLLVPFPSSFVGIGS